MRKFPEIGRDELFRFFTLIPADIAFVDPGRGRAGRARTGGSLAAAGVRGMTEFRCWPRGRRRGLITGRGSQLLDRRAEWCDGFGR
jgi:hypothetical protein